MGWITNNFRLYHEKAIVNDGTTETVTACYLLIPASFEALPYVHGILINQI